MLRPTELRLRGQLPPLVRNLQLILYIRLRERPIGVLEVIFLLESLQLFFSSIHEHSYL